MKTLLAAATLTASAWAQPTAIKPAQVTAPDPPALEAPRHQPGTPASFEQLALRAAAEYAGYTQVSEEPLWSPIQCFIPKRVGASTSSSRDSETHGRKLYYLYAKDATAYYSIGLATKRGVFTPSSFSPVGQVIVKESFAPIPVAATPPPELKKLEAPATLAPERRQSRIDDEAERRKLDIATLDGNVYCCGEPTGLFIMMKLDRATPDTDEGWVYAVTSPDATKVLQAGRIESCIDCHQETGRDRLYGARWTWPRNEKGKPVPPSLTPGSTEK